MTMVKAFVQTCLRLLLILTFAKCKIPDARVTCLFSGRCVLPCTFNSSGNENIFWYRQEVPILNQTQQGGHQSDRPTQVHVTRMYLILEQLSKGNASLHINGCGIKDRGRYRCLVNSTRTEHESFVVVKVEAPIKTVTMEKSSNKEVLCLSKDIYPAPRVLWSTLPREDNLRPTTQMTANSKGLYSVQSKLKMSGNILTYICTVNSMYGSQSWRSSLQEGELIGKVGRDMCISCIAPQNVQIFSLTWTFTRTNKSSNILSYANRTIYTSKNWMGRAGLERHQVLIGNGSLLLRHPDSQENTGTYTCTLIGNQSRTVVQTHVTIRTNPEESVKEAGRSGRSKSYMWLIAVCIAAVAVAVVTALLLYRKRRAMQRQSGRTVVAVEETEVQPMNTMKTAEDLPVDSHQL